MASAFRVASVKSGVAQQLEQGVLLPAEQAAFLHGGLPVARCAASP